MRARPVMPGDARLTRATLDPSRKGRQGPEARHMVLLITKQGVENVHPLNIEAHVMFVRDADAPVELNRLLSNVATAKCKLNFSGRNRSLPLKRIRLARLGQSHNRHRFRQLRLREHVYRAVLQRLERSNLRTKLLPCLKVFHGHC